MSEERRKFRRPIIFPLVVSLMIIAGTPATAQDFSASFLIKYKIDQSRKNYTLKSEESLRYKYLSERSTSQRDHLIYEPYYAKIKDLKARLNGDKIKKSQIGYFKDAGSDRFFPDDAHYAVLITSAIRPGDVFTCNYRQEFDSIEYFPIIHVPNGGYIEEYRITIEHPKEISVSFEYFFPHGEVPYVVSRDNEKHTTLTFSDLSEIEKKPFFDYNEYQAAILVTLLENGQPITPTSPEEFVRWYGSLTSLSPTMDSTHHNFLAEDLQSASSDRDRLSIINDYVRESVRHIEEHIGGHAIVPHDPSLVCDRNYGDCKDRAALVSAIAREYGIPVYMVLVSVFPPPDFTGVHMNQFDHVICYHHDGETGIFFDPSDRFRKMGDLWETLIGKRALILDSENPRFEIIDIPFEKPAIEIFIAGRRDSLAHASAEVTVRYDFLGIIRQAVEELTGAKLENFLSDMISSRAYKIGMENYEVIAEDDQSLTLSAEADLSQFIIASADRRYVPKTSFTLVGNDMLSRRDDSLPIHSEGRMWLRLVIDLEAEDIIAEADSIISDYGKTAGYRAAMVPEKGRIRFEYEYIRPVKNLAGRNRQEFLDMITWYKSQKNEMFLMRREE